MRTSVGLLEPSRGFYYVGVNYMEQVSDNRNCSKCVWRLYKDKGSGKMLCFFPRCMYGKIDNIKQDPVPFMPKKHHKRHKKKKYKSPL